MQRGGSNGYPHSSSPSNDDWWGDQKLPYEDTSQTRRKSPPDQVKHHSSKDDPDFIVPNFVETEHDASESYAYNTAEETCVREATTTAADMIASIEIAPGEYRRLLGAAASWRSMENDSFVVATCWACDTMVFNVPQAAYVLCPTCRSVNPMEDMCEKDEIVGLGFTVGDLESWQQNNSFPLHISVARETDMKL